MAGETRLIVAGERDVERGREGANVLSALRQTFSLPGLFLVASHLAYITKGSSREGKYGRFFPCFFLKVMDGWMPL